MFRGQESVFQEFLTKSMMEKQPRSGASVIVFDKRTSQIKVLLIKRGKPPYQGHWSLPGGSQELGETIEECAAREVMEETNLTITDLKFAGINDRISRNESGEIEHHFLLTTFKTDSFQGTPLASDDAADLGWFTHNEMQDLLTTPETPKFVGDVLGHEFTKG